MNCFARIGTATLLAFVVSLGAATAASITLTPDEDASKDVFVYAFSIPGTLGIPTPPNSSNFDTANVPASAAVPFGAFLGAAETVPFRTDPTDPDEPLRAHTTRSLLEFDLSSVALTGRGVASASLTLFAIPGLPPFDDPSAENPVDLALKQVMEAWDEGTVTWDTRPAVGQTAAFTTIATAPTADMPVPVRFDITDLVSMWLDDPASNFGLEISQAGIQANPQIGDRDRFSVALFASSAFPDPSLRPTLSIQPVPLPASAPLLLGAAALIGFMARRRKR